MRNLNFNAIMIARKGIPVSYWNRYFNVIQKGGIE